MVSDAENARCTVKSTTNQLLKNIEDRPLTEIAIDQPTFTAASKKKNWSARVSCVKVKIKILRHYQPHKMCSQKSFDCVYKKFWYGATNADAKSGQLALRPKLFGLSAEHEEMAQAYKGGTLKEQYDLWVFQRDTIGEGWIPIEFDSIQRWEGSKDKKARDLAALARKAKKNYFSMKPTKGDGSVDVPCGGPMDGGCVWRSLAKLVVFTPAELEVLSGANPGTLKDLRLVVHTSLRHVADVCKLNVRTWEELHAAGHAKWVVKLRFSRHVVAVVGKAMFDGDAQTAAPLVGPVDAANFVVEK